MDTQEIKPIKMNMGRLNIANILNFAVKDRIAVIGEIPSLSTSPKKSHSVASLMKSYMMEKTQMMINAAAKI